VYPGLHYKSVASALHLWHYGKNMKGPTHELGLWAVIKHFLFKLITNTLLLFHITLIGIEALSFPNRIIV
jgi:hypothetical protein